MPLLSRESRKRFRELLLCAFFWINWKEQNGRSFENVELSDHRLKILFLSILFSWSKLFIGERLLSLFDFIDWLSVV